MPRIKRILVDTNVVLDLLLSRMPHFPHSAAVCAAVETRLVDGYLAAHTITTIDYLAARELGPTASRHLLKELLRVFKVAAEDGTVIRKAIDASTPDFEDAVTAAAAEAAGCDFIVTRDPKGFRGSPVPHLSPEAAVPLLTAARGRSR